MPIASNEWDSLISALRSSDDADRLVSAAERIHRDATLADVPVLMTLLQNADAFTREAAAWPISELVGPPALRELLTAYQRGLDEGLDNDGFTAALIDLVEGRPSESTAVLRALYLDGEPSYARECHLALRVLRGQELREVRLVFRVPLPQILQRLG
jgi:hypothetical protein